MAHRTLELDLISANDLKQVTLSSKMEVYTISSIDGNPSSQQCSSADREGGTNPVWNTTHRFSIPTGDPSNHFLHVLLRCHHDLGDLDIGEIRIPLKELLNCFAAGEGDRQFVRCQLQNLHYKFLDVTPLRADEPVKALKDGEPVTGYTNTSPPPGYGYLESDPARKDGGVVNLSFKFLDAVPLRADEPVTAAGYGYPMPAPTGYGYPPAGGLPPYAQPYMSPAGYGYPAPAPAGYGYPPVGYGYGATHSSWNVFGAGMELLSEALRVGVLIGNILSGGSGDGGDYSDG